MDYASYFQVISEPSNRQEPLNMGEHYRKMSMMFREIRQAKLTSALKRMLRDELRYKRLQTRTPETPQLLQLASVNDPKGIADDLPDEKMKSYARKLRRRYLKTKKAMCKNCKGQVVTTVHTSFKVDGHEEKVKMQAVIIDLNQLEVMDDTRIEEIFTHN